jgi:hypothetical protein
MRPAAGAFWSPPSTENCRRQVGDRRTLSGGNGEGAGPEGWYIEGYKSARGVHKIFACNLRCSNTTSASVACSFPVIYRSCVYSLRETPFDCVSPARDWDHCLKSVRSPSRASEEAKRVITCWYLQRSDCSSAKLRLQADASGSHRIVFGHAPLLRDATRTSVADGHDPPT